MSALWFALTVVAVVFWAVMIFPWGKTIPNPTLVPEPPATRFLWKMFAAICAAVPVVLILAAAFG